MRRYRLSRPTKADLYRIWLRIARDADIEKADRFIDSITARFPMLAGMPEAGRASDEIEPGLREISRRELPDLLPQSAAWRNPDITGHSWDEGTAESAG